MSIQTNIEWCDSTWNPWEGCQKIGPGCDHCYAETRNARFNGGVAVNWGPGAPRRRTSEANWRKPLGWEKAHAAFFAQHGRRQRVFCASLADVFDNAVPDEWRCDLWDLISATPHLDWLLLTKRIGNAHSMLPWIEDDEFPGCDPLQNVWLGITVCNQEEADRDIPKLLEIPAQVRFLSIEPMLSDIDILRWLGGTAVVRSNGSTGSVVLRKRSGLDWIIAGGESGHKARPSHPDWFRSLRDQCAAAGVPFLFKQWGAYTPLKSCVQPDTLYLTTKAAAGRLLDGIEHNGFPVAA